jgi:hypothetical protein
MQGDFQMLQQTHREEKQLGLVQAQAFAPTIGQTIPHD